MDPVLLAHVDIVGWVRRMRDDHVRAPTPRAVDAAWEGMAELLERESLAFVDRELVLRRGQFSDDGWRFATLEIIRWWTDAFHCRGAAPRVEDLAGSLAAFRRGAVADVGLQCGLPFEVGARRPRGGVFVPCRDGDRLTNLHELVVEPSEARRSDLVTIMAIGLWAQREDIVAALDEALQATPHDRQEVTDGTGRGAGVVYAPAVSLERDLRVDHPLPGLYAVAGSRTLVCASKGLVAAVVRRCSRARIWATSQRDVAAGRLPS